ncbi:MAG: HAMP domain-containing histidine kinase [Bacteroidetes bacterium]|nr:HAMP domain-containing histidine kinase [Bacteroidota bacterium]
MRQYLNWKTGLVLAALVIVAASLSYTSRLANNLAAQEQKNMQQISEALRTMANVRSDQDKGFDLALNLVKSNSSIPFIWASEDGQILDYKNIDTSGIRDVPSFLKKKMKAYGEERTPILVELTGSNQYVYYGESSLLRQLRYFPYIQLAIILLFLVVVVIAIIAAQRSIQNRVWLGLSKETAHQLGTPLMALEGWVEILREQECNQEAVQEMNKDLARLRLIAERFSKVGSEPQLAVENVVFRLQQMAEYMRRRAPNSVQIRVQSELQDIPVAISGPLFDWVIENLIRNALDAMKGPGRIEIRVMAQEHSVEIDLSDTGKGIPRHQLRKIFQPGFTTKKRGWGLGLSLSRRIIREYHHGSLFVRSSEPGQGTTFRIILKR